MILGNKRKKGNDIIILITCHLRGARPRAIEVERDWTLVRLFMI